MPNGTDMLKMTLNNNLDHVNLMDGTDLELIPLNSICRGHIQARQTDMYAGVQDLADSILSWGLLDPIHVSRTEENGVYELLDGQRRFLAFSLLHERHPERFAEVPSFVHGAAMDDWEKKTLSIHANLLQMPMHRMDRVNAVTVVFKRFGSIKRTAEATGLSESTIRLYVEAARLPAALRDAVAKGTVSMKVALYAADMNAYDPDKHDNADDDEMLETAKEIQSLTGKQKQYAREMKKNEPGRPVREILADVRSVRRAVRDITISIESDTYSRIDLYRERAGLKTVESATLDLVEDGLATNEV